MNGFKIILAVCLLGVLASGAFFFYKIAPPLFQSNPSPEQLGRIGAKINQHPSRAEKILQTHDLSRNEYKQLIWNYTSNPNQARRYTQAYRAEQNRSPATP